MHIAVSAGLWLLLWRQSKTESGVRLFGCYITVLFITGNWVVFLKVTTWLSKLNITNKAQPLCPFSGASRRIRHFLRRGNWQTAMIITEALSVLSSSPGHIQAWILSFACLHLYFLLFGSHRDAEKNLLQRWSLNYRHWEKNFASLRLNVTMSRWIYNTI